MLAVVAISIQRVTRDVKLSTSVNRVLGALSARSEAIPASTHAATPQREGPRRPDRPAGRMVVAVHQRDVKDNDDIRMNIGLHTDVCQFIPSAAVAAATCRGIMVAEPPIEVVDDTAPGTASPGPWTSTTTRTALRRLLPGREFGSTFGVLFEAGSLMPEPRGPDLDANRLYNWVDYDDLRDNNGNYLLDQTSGSGRRCPFFSEETSRSFINICQFLAVYGKVKAKQTSTTPSTSARRPASAPGTSSSSGTDPDLARRERDRIRIVPGSRKWVARDHDPNPRRPGGPRPSGLRCGAAARGLHPRDRHHLGRGDLPAASPQVKTKDAIYGPIVAEQAMECFAPSSTRRTSAASSSSGWRPATATRSANSGPAIPRSSPTHRGPSRRLGWMRPSFLLPSAAAPRPGRDPAAITQQNRSTRRSTSSASRTRDLAGETPSSPARTATCSTPPTPASARSTFAVPGDVIRSTDPRSPTRTRRGVLGAGGDPLQPREVRGARSLRSLRIARELRFLGRLRLPARSRTRGRAQTWSPSPRASVPGRSGRVPRVLLGPLFRRYQGRIQVAIFVSTGVRGAGLITVNACSGDTTSD